MMQRLEGASGTDPRRADGRTLPQLMRDRAREHGSRVAMRRKRHGVWQPTSWAETWEIVGALATALRALGIQRGDRVAIISENIPEAYWLEYAALCCGASRPLPVPGRGRRRAALHPAGQRRPRAPRRRPGAGGQGACRVPSAPNLLRIVYVDARGLWHEAEPRLMHFPALLEMGRQTLDPSALQTEIAAGKPDDPAVICYTSGTTGLPKGVVLSHDYLLANAYRLMAGFRLRPHTQYLSYISPAWAAEQICGIALGLLAPMTIGFAEKPETVREDMRELGPEFLMFTPRQWEMLAADVDATMLDAPAWRQSLYRWAIRTGGPSRRPPRPRRHPRQARPLARHAPRSAAAPACLPKCSAASAPSASRSPTSTARPNSASSPPTGRKTPTRPPWANSSPAIPARKTCKSRLSDFGELLVEQGAHFHGYWNDPESTAKVPTSTGLRTGDAVRMSPDRQLVFLDRLKDMRQLAGGEWFPPQFIENQLRASPFVRDAMVIGDERHAFVSALVNINAAIAGRFAERKGLAYGTFTELSQLPEIRAEVHSLIAGVNRSLEAPTRVRRFATLPKELDADDSELTRSRKLRRGQIEENYADIITGLYGNGTECDARLRVQYRDGSDSAMVVRVALNDVELAA